MRWLRYIRNQKALPAVEEGMRALLSVTLLITLAAGCGSESADRTDPPRSENRGLVLEVERVPGGPAIALYADGRMFTPAAQIALYPGPALPGYSVGQLPPARVLELVDAIAASGVLAGGDSPPVPDAPTTLVTALVDGELRTVRLDPERAVALDRLLADLPVSSGDSLYEPEALAVFAGAPQEAAEGIEPETREWPLGDLPPGCSVIRGADLAPVLAAARQANQLTRWRIAGGLTVGVTFRPLLPHETICDDVAGR